MQFLALNKILTKQYAQLRLFKFPPKRWFSSLAEGTIERRRVIFQAYLQQIVRRVHVHCACVLCLGLCCVLVNVLVLVLRGCIAWLC